MAIDIGQDIGNVNSSDLESVINQARLLMRLDLEIGQLEVKLKEQKQAYNKLATETLPELMDSVDAGTAIPLGNGYTLQLEDVFRANIPAESTIEKADDEERPALEKRRADALSWLRQNKASDIIKNTLKVDLGKGQDSIAKKFAALAEKLKVPLKRSETVHYQTLANLLQEKLEAGTEVPFETFSVFKGRKATIQAPKKPKEKK